MGLNIERRDCEIAELRPKMLLPLFEVAWEVRLGEQPLGWSWLVVLAPPHPEAAVRSLVVRESYLLDGLAGTKLRPVASWWKWDVGLPARLGQCDVRDPELGSDLADWAAPEQLVHLSPSERLGFEWHPSSSHLDLRLWPPRMSLLRTGDGVREGTL